MVSTTYLSKSVGKRGFFHQSKEFPFQKARFGAGLETLGFRWAKNRGKLY